MKKSFTVILLICLGFSLQAQEGSGIYFKDYFTGEAISEVKVYLDSVQIAISDEEGFVSTETPELEQLGYALVLAQKEGYSSKMFGMFTSDSLGQRSVFSIGFIELRPFSYELPEGINITSSRSPAGSLTSPAAMSILEQATLEENQARSMAEALIGVPGVWMQKTNHGGGSPFVRGLTGNQTLLMIDGIRMNNATYRYGPNQYLNTVDPASLSRVEVMRGQGSVQYGTDALGGTVNLLTQQLTFAEDGISVSGRISGKYLGYNMERSGRASVNVSGKKIAFSGGVSYKDFGDLVAGGELGTLAPSAYEERDLDAKLQWFVAPQHKLTLLYQQVVQTGVDRYDQVAQRGYQIYRFDPQIRKLAYLRLENFIDKPWLDKIQTTVSWQRSEETRIKQWPIFLTQFIDQDNINTLGTSVEAISHFGPWSMTSGIEWYADQVGSRTIIKPLFSSGRKTVRGLYPDGSTATQAGLFSLHTYERGRWQLNAGLRLNTFQLEASDETFGELSVSPTALVGNAAFIWKLNRSSSLILSANSGFRAPNINDLSSFGSFDSGIEVPSPDLQPERSLTYEIGYKKAGDFISWELFAYHTDLLNLITRTPSRWEGREFFNGERVYKKVNLESAFLRGAEANIRYRPAPGLSVDGSLIYTYGADADGNPLRRIPPVNGRVLLRYERNNWWGKAELLFAGAQTRLSAGDIDDHRIAEGGTPGWTVINLRGGYDWKQVSLRVGLENLLDEAYRIHGSGVDGMGRNLWVGLEWRIGKSST